MDDSYKSFMQNIDETLRNLVSCKRLYTILPMQSRNRYSLASYKRSKMWANLSRREFVYNEDT